MTPKEAIVDRFPKNETSTDEAPASPAPARLPWIPPTFETVTFDEAKNTAGAGGDAGGSVS
jgi:hypothetical protein